MILKENYELLKEGNYISFVEGEAIVKALKDQIQREKIPSFALIFETEGLQAKYISRIDENSSDSESLSDESGDEEEVKESIKKGDVKNPGAKRLNRKRKAGEEEVAGTPISSLSSQSFYSNIRNQEPSEKLSFWQTLNVKTVDRAIKTCSRHHPDSKNRLGNTLFFPHAERVVQAVKEIKKQWNSIDVPLKNELKKYQIENLKRILILSKQENQGFILGDEVGLGKTIQIAAVILKKLEEFGFVVVVATASTIKQTKATLQECLFKGALSQFEKELQVNSADGYETLYNEFIHYKEFIDNRVAMLYHKRSKQLTIINKNSARKEGAQKKYDSYNFKLKILEGGWSNKIEEILMKFKSKIPTKRKVSRFETPSNPNLKHFDPFDIVQESSSQKKFSTIMPLIKQGSRGVILFTPDILSKSTIHIPLSNALKSSSISLFVMDEAHGLSHRGKKIYQALQTIFNSMPKRPPILLATATPFNNTIASTFTIFETILHLTKEEREKWIKMEEDLIECMQQSKGNLGKLLLLKDLSEEKVKGNLKFFIETFANFEVFRRVFHLQCGRHIQDKVREDWDGKIPTKKFNQIQAPLAGRQLELSEELSNNFLQQTTKKINFNGMENDRSFLQFYQRMQFVSFHPDFLNMKILTHHFPVKDKTTVEKEAIGEFEKKILEKIKKFTVPELDEWISQSSVLKEFFDETKETGILHSIKNQIPTLVFVNRLVVGEALKTCINKKMGLKNIPFLNGSTEIVERQQIVENFNEYQTPIVLISISAGGAGLNFKKTRKLFLMGELVDRCNPTTSHQAIGRGCRAGEEGEVEIIQYHCHTEIEKRVSEIKDSKSRLEKMMLDTPLSQEENIAENFLNFIKAIFPPLPYLKTERKMEKMEERKKGLLNYFETMILDEKDVIWEKIKEVDSILRLQETEDMEIEEKALVDQEPIIMYRKKKILQKLSF